MVVVIPARCENVLLVAYSYAVMSRSFATVSTRQNNGLSCTHTAPAHQDVRSIPRKHFYITTTNATNPNTTQHQTPTQLLTSTTTYSSPQKHNHVRLKHLQQWSGSGCNEPLSQYPNLCFHEVTAPSSLSTGTTSASFRIFSLSAFPGALGTSSCEGGTGWQVESRQAGGKAGNLCCRKEKT